MPAKTMQIILAKACRNEVKENLFLEIKHGNLHANFAT